MGIKLGEAFGRVRIDSSGVKTGVDSARSQLEGFSSDMKRIGGNISGAGKKLTAGITVPLLGLAGITAKTAGDFEEQMNILSLAAGGADASLDDLRNTAIAIGADTDLVGVSASESADAMTNFYKAGLTTNEILGDMEGYLAGTSELSGAMRAAIDLAAASELDLAASSDIVTIAMSTFGLSADEAVGIADNFVQTADASVASVGELAAAMVNVGPTAAAFGWSMEDTNTALAILSERGIRGSEAGTALKSMMTNLMSPTGAASGTLKELGVSLYAATGEMKPLDQIMGELGDSMAGFSEEERNMAIQTLAGSYGMKAMNTFLAEGTDGWNEMETGISNAATAQESASARTKGLNAVVEQLKGTMETLMIKVGTPLIENVFTPMVQKVTELAGRFTALPESMQMNIVKGLALAAALGPLLVVVGHVITAVGVIAGVLTGPVALAIGAVIAVVALLALAWKNNFGGIQEKTAVFWEKAKVVFGQLRVWFAENLPIAIMYLSNLWNNYLLPAFIAAGNFIGAVLVPAFIWIGEIILNNFVAKLKILWAFLSEYVFPILDAVGKLLLAAFSYALNFVSTLITNIIVPALTKMWSWLEEKLGPTIEKVGNWLKDKFGPALRGVGDAFKGVVDWIGKMADKLANLDLPDWMTPGSPTPWENGLVGIKRAMDEVSRSGLPTLNAGLKLLPEPALGLAGSARGAGAGGGSVLNNNQRFGDIIVNVTGSNASPAQIGRATRNGVLEAMRARGM